MKIPMKSLAFLLFLLTAIVVINVDFFDKKPFSEGPDVAGRLHYLGNPYHDDYPEKEAIYARNIWDMQLFQGRIFIGAGNSSNEGPAQNAGPVRIIVYVPNKKIFVTEGTVSDEQIDLYRTMDGKLYIPGHDATGSWQWGNIYERTVDGKWLRERNLPGALHVYDLAQKGNRLFAAVGLRAGAAVLMSEDGGAHWKKQLLGKGRVYAFMPIGDSLLALKKFKRTSDPYLSAAQYMGDGIFSARYDMTSHAVFPDTVLREKYAKVVRITRVGDQTLYIGGYKNNDHQTLPFGLYSAHMQEGRFRATRIDLPEGVLPRDLLVRQGRAYLLTQKAGNPEVISVWSASTQNLLEWKALFHFTYTSFARSFEKMGNTFYFGMGCDVDPQHWKESDLPEQTGDILQVTYPDEGGQ